MDDAKAKETVVCLDLSRYSATSRSLEVGHQLGAQALIILNNQILALVRQAAADARVDFERTFIKGTGDGAILAFSTPAAAERFAVAFHGRADEHSRHAVNDTEYSCFRVGIYSGELVRTDGDVAGVAVGFAARLEAAAKTGQILIDAESWSRLPAAQQRLYGDVETIHGKAHDPTFQIRRRQVVTPAPWDTEGEAVAKPLPRPQIGEPGPTFQHVALVWDPEVVSSGEYAKLVTAIGDVARASGATGVRRILTKYEGAHTRTRVPV